MLKRHEADETAIGRLMNGDKRRAA